MKKELKRKKMDKEQKKDEEQKKRNTSINGVML